MSRTLEQQRATYAMNFVTGYTGDKAKLATHIRKTPIRILQNGLGQALAFLLSDNEGKTGNERKPSGYLYDCLEAWLCGPDSPAHPCRVYNGQQCNFMKQLIEGERGPYLQAQEEAIRLFGWLKKFADAYLEEGTKNAGQIAT